VEKKSEIRLTGPVNHRVLIKVNRFAKTRPQQRGGFFALRCQYEG
jgi:hypothetical protein